MPLNADWHRRHPMPPKPTLEERVRWHVEHQKQCGCRQMPKTVRDALRKRPRETGVR